jgi:hypothetical protein
VCEGNAACRPRSKAALAAPLNSAGTIQADCRVKTTLQSFILWVNNKEIILSTAQIDFF